MASKSKSKPLNGKTPNIHHTGVDAQTVLDRALKSMKSDIIQSLLDGNNAVQPSASEADLVLCNHLVFFSGYIPDPDVYRIIDSIIRKSKRMRPKWDEIRRPADGATYGQMTIETAISGTTDRYRAQAKDDPDLWDFDDAEIHIEKQRGRDLSSSQKLELTGDILRHHDFDVIQRAIMTPF